MNELKPCPFCGGKAIFYLRDVSSGSIQKEIPNMHGTMLGRFYFRIKCKKCGAEATTYTCSFYVAMLDDGSVGVVDYQDDRTFATTAWNRRAQNE